MNTFNWPAEAVLELERVDDHTLECRCVFVPRQIPEQFRDIKVPKRPLVGLSSMRDLAFRFLARGQR